MWFYAFWVVSSLHFLFKIINSFGHIAWRGHPCLRNQDPLAKLICKQICGTSRYVNFKLSVVRLFLKLDYSLSKIYICICIVYSIYYKEWEGKELLTAQHENLENGKTPVTRKLLYAFPNISSSLLTLKGTIFLNHIICNFLAFFHSFIT